MGKVRIYLDDMRPCPIGWTEAKTPIEFIKVVYENLGNIEAVSFDHDLSDIEDKGQEGFNEITGYDCARWLIETHLLGRYKLPYMETHTSNPVGRERIERLLGQYF